jgi:hypothetical protein
MASELNARETVKLKKGAVLTALEPNPPDAVLCRALFDFEGDNSSKVAFKKVRFGCFFFFSFVLFLFFVFFFLFSLLGRFAALLWDEQQWMGKREAD